jgi:hypothetical protein
LVRCAPVVYIYIYIYIYISMWCTTIPSIPRNAYVWIALEGDHAEGELQGGCSNGTWGQWREKSEREQGDARALKTHSKKA